jgi:SPP1 family predicted phage head-tail adaptor
MSKICSLKCLKMDKRIALQVVTQTSDGQGGYTESWATTATIWAEIKPQSGYVKFQAFQNENPTSHDITIRYRNDITIAKRFLFGSRVFLIKEIINIEEASVFMRIKAVEV